MYNKEELAEQLNKLMPPGTIFNNVKGSTCNLLFEALSSTYKSYLDSLENLPIESNPLTSSELLDIRYQEAGLPYSCDRTLPQTTEEQRFDILTAWRSVGGCTKQFFLDLLTGLGVQASIVENYSAPATATCVGACNLPLDDISKAWTWTINYVDDAFIPGTEFISGANTAGEPLGTVPTIGSVINKFQCYIEKVKPAHTTVIYNPVSSL